MKIISMVTFLWMLSIYSYAQNDSYKYSLNFRAGSSFPLSRFADKTFSNSPGESSGLAKTGLGIDLDIRYRIQKNVGITFLLGSSFNKQDEKAYSSKPLPS